MGQFSIGFNFDDFDEQCREAIEGAEHADLDAKLCLEGIADSVLYREWAGEPEPPQAA